MRTIQKSKKSTALALLESEKKKMQESGISVLYDNFNPKKELNDYLRQEQHGVCCYCQRRITHHNKPNEDGSHNEHFYPENGINGREDLQLDYNNLFACCNTTKDFEEKLKHCGDAKHDTLLDPNFLLDSSCSTLFKYNHDGEMTPTGPYRTYAEFLDNEPNLTHSQQSILYAIKVLNLNVNSLKEMRLGIQSDTFKFMIGKTAAQLQHKIAVLNVPSPDEDYVPMVDFVIFLLKERVSFLNSRDQH